MNTLVDYAETPQQDYSFDEFVVKDVPLDVAREFLSQHHYLGGCGNAAMPWGLYSQRTSELLGIIAFQTPISEAVRASVFGKKYKERVTEFHRMAIVDRAPSNTATWFIARTLDELKDYKPKYWAVVTFADTTVGHDGTVYQASNADYYGTTGEHTFYRTQDGDLKAPRQVGENITIQDALDRGWTPEQRDAKHRYVYWLPDEYQSKDELREKSNLELQPYP
jgi:hypothetical protein